MSAIMSAAAAATSADRSWRAGSSAIISLGKNRTVRRPAAGDCEDCGDGWSAATERRTADGGPFYPGPVVAFGKRARADGSRREGVGRAGRVHTGPRL